jgi:hypothetical protein
MTCREERHHSGCVCDTVIWFDVRSKLVPVARSWPPAKRKVEAFKQKRPINYRERKVQPWMPAAEIF